jgi:hypothetical protein
MRGVLDKDIYEAIAELGRFFRELCSRTLNKDVLAEMKKEIQEIKVFLMNTHMVSMFLAMEFILLLHLNCNMMKMALIKWCGMCLTTVLKLRNM